MKHFEKTVSLVLALAFAATAAACAGGGVDKPGNSKGTQSQPTGDNDRLNANDGIEAVDFKGLQYKISISDNQEFEMFSDDTTDTVDAAVYERNMRVEDKYKIDIFAREIISDPAHRSRVSRIYGINRFRKTYFTAERRKSIKKRIHRLRIYTVIAPLQYCYSLHRPSSLSVHRKSPCLRAGKPKRDIRYFRLRPLSVIL